MNAHIKLSSLLLFLLERGMGWGNFCPASLCSGDLPGVRPCGVGRGTLLSNPTAAQTQNHFADRVTVLNDHSYYSIFQQEFHREKHCILIRSKDAYSRCILLFVQNFHLNSIDQSS
jgi:hypothetical protein